MAKQAMTHVAGFFNSAKWPIQIVLSKPSITLTLVPGAFICNASGQKINDPYFETYAEHGQLSRELSDVPVPICRLPTLAQG